MRPIAIRIANIALFVLCCFMAGGLVSEISASLLIPEGTRAWEPSAAVRPTSETWTDRQVILERNVFGALVSESDVVSEEPEPEPETTELIETELPLRLLATVAGTSEDISRAVIEDKTQRKHEVLQVGDTLANHPAVRLTKIQRRWVQLDNAGVPESLSLDEEDGAGPSSPRLPTRVSRSQPDRSAAAARSSSSSSRTRGRLAERLRKMREVSRAQEDEPEDLEPTLEEEGEEPFGLSMQTQMELFSQARIMPKYEEGQMIGIQLNKIKEGSLYEKVGLGDGDVITEVNGITIDRPAASPQFIEQLAEAEFLDISVLRANGVEETLSVATEEIRNLE